MRRRNAQNGQARRPAEVFGELLAHHREAAGLRQADLARLLHCDRSHVTRIEAGTRVPDEPLVIACDQLLRTGGTLLRLWRRIDWYSQIEHPDWFQRRADMDAELVTLREYQSGVVPGLLQAESYARSLYSRRYQDSAKVEGLVRARLSRQQRFLAADGPLYVAMLDESCLRSVMGSAAGMREQCAHLLTVGERPNIRIQVAPADQPGLRRPTTSMSLIKLPDGHEWVYSESLDRGHFNDDPQVFARHSQTYDVLRADALSAPDSAALIRDLMGRYGQHGQAGSSRGDVAQEQPQRRQRRQLHRNSPRYPRRRPGA
ncbi:helix-turn-helix domain-containing protein [Streptomyces sp. NPDC018019]|uniref:helix-turn-helix domain-containing protein n=1 Tax=Streptomyces sp. NPDC018019 TaxID=3365030 RepID=UPI0037BD96CB